MSIEYKENTDFVVLTTNGQLLVLGYPRPLGSEENKALADTSVYELYSSNKISFDKYKKIAEVLDWEILGEL